jgi:CubicO group peptidase (beta-lactamase class C family)
MAVEQGRLRYEAKVSEYWPEFAQQGKGDITVADVLRHEGGLAYFEGKLPMHLAGRDRFDEMAEFLAAQKPYWQHAGATHLAPGARVYHGLTRGFLLNELVRRTDPQGRSIGRILREDVAQPLGVSIILGDATAEELRRHHKVEFDGFHHTVGKSVWAELTRTAKPDDRARAQAFFSPRSDVKKWLECFHIDPARLPFTQETYFQHDEFLSNMEVPSANMVANARALAQVADRMARQALLSPAAHALAHAAPSTKYDHGLCFETTFNQGGWCLYDDPRFWDPCLKSFVGWGGFGGSQIAWSTDRKVGIAFTMNGALFNSLMGFRDPRCLGLMRETIKAIERLEAAQARSPALPAAPASRL